jgi:hypothetical protein
LDYYFEWTTANFAIRGERLVGDACIDQDLKPVPAKWTLDFFGNFHHFLNDIPKSESIWK